jgi:hypothetical protein
MSGKERDSPMSSLEIPHVVIVSCTPLHSQRVEEVSWYELA